MKAKRQRIVRQRTGEAKIEFSTAFSKEKFPNWDKNIRSKEGERKIKKKPTAQDKWAELQAFAAAELK